MSQGQAEWNHIYLSLPVPDDTIPSVVSEGMDEGWNIVLESLFDDASKTFAKAARDIGIPAPSEDDIGYEVFINGRATDVMLEIAWSDLKIGYLTNEQTENQEMLEQHGWTIIDLMNIEEKKNMFGGKE